MSKYIKFDHNGNIIEERVIEVEPQPLDAVGVLATLLAVTGTLTVQDAANAVGLTADDLIVEAQAWAVAGS